MRHFSDNEKQIIKRLSDIERFGQIAIINYIYDDSNYMALEWDIDYKELWIYFKERNVSEEEAFKVYSKLLDAIFLIEYLENEHVINLYSLSNQLYHEENGKRMFYNKKYEKNSELDTYFEITNEGGKITNFGTRHQIYTDIGRKIELYSNRLVHVSETLRDFTKNKFRTKSEINSTYNLVTAWIAITVSILMGITGLFKKDNSRVELVNDNLINISSKLDSINSNVIKSIRDTLNVIK